MSKLYVFGIGGTGSRVLKSLTMLLAAGVQVNVDEIVPIVVDPDLAAADLTRTLDMMQHYKNIYDKIDHNSYQRNAFFGTKINLDIVPDVRIPLDDTENKKFRDFIGLSSMRDDDGNFNANYALASILFSEKNLESTMEVGFKGNPNIGSVVLNQFVESKAFKDFAASVGQDDKIFIISSIFGGTGASGLPLLLKNLRAIDSSMNGCNNVKNAAIAAIPISPYFNVKPSDESEIDSSTFISKTKAALLYYDTNVKEANVMYYLADNRSRAGGKAYENCEGGSGQRNDAHFIELAAALAAIDFANMDGLQTKDGKPRNIVYKEFGIDENSPQLVYNDLCDVTTFAIKKPLTEFLLFCKYLNEQLKESKNQQPWSRDHKLDDNFFTSQFFVSDVLAIKDSFMNWMEEMARNDRGFAPYDLRENKDDLFNLIKEVPPAKVMSLKKNYALFDSYLNNVNLRIMNNASKEQVFVELFYHGIETLVKDKFRME